MKQSSLFKLNWSDVAKGLVVAAISGGLTSLMQVFDAGAMPTGAQFKAAGLVALSSGVAYLFKNFFTNSDGTIAKKEEKAA